jgi:hypothetical protein
MAAARTAAGVVPLQRLESAWPDAVQRRRCLESLAGDGLLVARDDGYALPG